LSDEGRLIFNEYVGACYNIYPSKQVSVINRLLGALHPIFKASPDAQLKNPTIEMVLAHDPSESVRSALILQFLQFYFEIEHLAFFGGTVLHPIFDQLNGRKLSDGSPESESIVRLLIEIEELLLENNVLLHDFCFGFCRRESGTRIKA
jgi:hypothetical protein